jgi:hypothetical protein
VASLFPDNLLAAAYLLDHSLDGMPGVTAKIYVQLREQSQPWLAAWHKKLTKLGLRWP